MSHLVTFRPVLTVMVLIAALVLPAGYVLCVGPNGHMAIESAHPDSGCKVMEGQTSASVGHFVEVASGDCVDLQLAAATWMSRPEQEEEQFDGIVFDLLRPIYLIDLTFEASGKPFHLSRWLDQDNVSELLLTLRSTVLLL